MFRTLLTIYENDTRAQSKLSRNIANKSVHQLTLEDDHPFVVKHLSPHPPNIPPALLNDTLFYEKFHLPLTFWNIFLLLLLILFTLWIILANLIVLIALKRCSGQGSNGRIATGGGKTKFNPIILYFGNLIVMDILIGLFVLPFMSTVVLIGYSPFGSILCHAWIFIDYYLIVNSSFGMASLMLIYCLMLNWTKQFLEFSTRSHLLFIFVQWVAVSVAWLPPFINHLHNSERIPGACGFSIHMNGYYALYLGVTGLYLPLFFLILPCFAYTVRILQRIRERTNRIFFASELIPSSMTTATANGHIGPNHEISAQFLKRILSRSFIFDTTAFVKAQETALGYFPLVGVIFATYLASKFLFYIYFGVGAFVENLFPPDLSNGVYWLMHGSAGLSPIIHLIFDCELRQECLKLLGLEKVIPPTKESQRKISIMNTSNGFIYIQNGNPAHHHNGTNGHIVPVG